MRSQGKPPILAIIGAGRVGCALGRHLHQKGWRIGPVVTRSMRTASAATRRIGAGKPQAGISDAILGADVVLIAGPIWLGDQSSLTRKIIERLYAYSGDVNEKGQWSYYGKVGGVLTTGNEDGGKHVSAQVLYALHGLGRPVGGAGEGAQRRRRAGGARAPVQVLEVAVGIDPGRDCGLFRAQHPGVDIERLAAVDAHPRPGPRVGQRVAISKLGGGGSLVTGRCNGLPEARGAPPVKSHCEPCRVREQYRREQVLEVDRGRRSRDIAARVRSPPRSSSSQAPWTDLRSPSSWFQLKRVGPS